MRVRAATARHRRQQRRDGVADARGVILGGPLRERHDVRRHERTGIEHLSDRLDVDVARHRPRVPLDDDAGHDPRPERYDDSSTNRRRIHAGRDGVRQKVEARNGDGYAY